ncbi:uncharacterized protein LOC131875145 [Cryptomeria japonica]|uniref:uncharacterized protein LOC131875145 n=1 Tax=Cryptomeria japonica TaxID=3369 RepID=UPI0027DA671C|nr:uncharacterized protein LOC131875145 [Cryptomeria japonica]
MKTEECEKLEQELKRLKVENKVLDSSKLLEEFINMEKAHSNKTGLGFQPGECSNHNDKDKCKEVKAEEEKKLEDSKIQNQSTNARRPPVHQPNAQRYPSFIGYYFQCGKFGHEYANCRSIQCYNCKRFGHKENYYQNHNLVGGNEVYNNFHRYFYTCTSYGHKANQCISRTLSVNLVKKNISCYKCKQSRHYANQCRNGNMDKSTEKNGMNNDGSKKKENLVWRKKEVDNGSKHGIPESSVGTHLFLWYLSIFLRLKKNI